MKTWFHLELFEKQLVMAANETTSPLKDAESNDDIQNITFEDKSDAAYLPLTWIVTVLVFSVLGNSFVICSFFRDIRMRVVFNLFVVHLATADFILSFLVTLFIVDGISQISLIGKWPLLCQVCTVVANALPLEQLILTHIICHDRHKALQCGMSYARNTFHWHVQKLILFLTWVVCFVISFLLTDLVSTVNVYGYSSCRSPGRLVYLSYTSFLYCLMLFSLAVAVMFIIWDFRKRRGKSPDFRRLQTDGDDESSFCMVSQTSNCSLQNKHSTLSLIPRSPVQVFRTFTTLLSPEVRRSPNTSKLFPSPSEFEPAEYFHAKPRDLHSQPLHHPYILDKHAGSPREIFQEESQSLHDAQNLEYERSCGFVQSKSIKDLDELNENFECKYDMKNTKYLMDHRRPKFEQILKSVVGIGIQNSFQGVITNPDMPDKSNHMQKRDIPGKSAQKLWSVAADIQNMQCRKMESRELSAATGEPPGRVGRLEYRDNVCFNVKYCNKEQQSCEDTEDRASNLSAEDLVPTSLSFSDDDFADFPLPRLKPRTDSLYTLRSCLSMPEEPMAKTAEVDAPSQSDTPTSNECSEIIMKLRRERRNDCKLFTIGDDDEESHRELNTDYNTEIKYSLTATYTDVKASQAPSAFQQSQLNLMSTLVEGHCPDVGTEKDSSIAEAQKVNWETVDYKKLCDTDMTLSATKPQEHWCLSHVNKLVVNDGQTQEMSAVSLSEPGADLSCVASHDSELCSANQNEAEFINISQGNVSESSCKKHQQTVTQGDVGEYKCFKTTSWSIQDDNNNAGTSKPRNSSQSIKKKHLTKDIAVRKNVLSDIQVQGVQSKTLHSWEEKALRRANESWNPSGVSCQEAVGTKGQMLTLEVRSPARNQAYHSTSIDNKFPYIPCEMPKEYQISFDRYYKTCCTVVRGNSNDCLDSHFSSKDIEVAVESWFQFYDIKMTVKRHDACGRISDECPQNCYRFISQADLGLTNSPLLRARRMWMEFYGISTPKVSPTREQGAEDHLFSVPVDVHALKENSSAIIKSLSEQTHYDLPNFVSNSISNDSSTDLQKANKPKMARRFKHVIKSMPAEKHCEDSVVISVPAATPDNFTQLSDQCYAVDKTNNITALDMPHDALQVINKDIKKFTDLALNTICHQSDIMSTALNKDQDQCETFVTVACKESCTLHEQFSVDSSSGAEGKDPMMLPQSLESNLALNTDFSNKRITQYYEEANVLEDIRNVEARAVSLIKNSEPVRFPSTVQEQGKTIDLNTYTQQGEQQIQTSKQILTTPEQDKSTVNDSNTPSKLLVLSQTGMATNNCELADKSTGGCNERQCLQLSQDINTAETAMTANQILESMSITCRALLAELGIYEDVLSGVIPLDKDVLCGKDIQNIIPCPDCERREREKLQKVTYEEADHPQATVDACAHQVSKNRKTNVLRVGFLQLAESNNSSAINVSCIDSAGRYSERNPESTSEIELFQEMDPNAGFSGLDFDLSTQKPGYFFRRLPQKFSCPPITAFHKLTFEELKKRDPELCILIILVCIVLLQLVCWFPIVVLYMVFDVTGFPSRLTCMELVFLGLWSSRMAIQPLLYACYSKYFRENYSQLLYCQCVKEKC